MKYTNVKYIGKEGIVQRGYTVDGEKSQPYRLNADGTSTPLSAGKPTSTKQDPGNSEPQQPTGLDLADKSNDVVGAGLGLAEIGVNQLDRAAAKATAAAETVEVVLQGVDAIKTAEGVAGVISKIGFASAVMMPV